MSPDHPASGIQLRCIRNGAHHLIRTLLTLCLSSMAPTSAADMSVPHARTTPNFRPQPAEEELSVARQRISPVGEQRIGDPEREFAMRMLESAQRELRLAETQASIATDIQIKQIANDTAASRRNEIKKLRAWLAQRKVLSTPRMLNR